MNSQIAEDEKKMKDSLKDYFIENIAKQKEELGRSQDEQIDSTTQEMEKSESVVTVKKI